MEKNVVSVQEKIVSLTDQIFKTEEKLKDAQENERHWRSQVTQLTNKLNNIKKEARELTSSVFE